MCYKEGCKTPWVLRDRKCMEELFFQIFFFNGVLSFGSNDSDFVTFVLFFFLHTINIAATILPTNERIQDILLLFVTPL